MSLIYRVLSPGIADFNCFENSTSGDVDLCVWETTEQDVARGQNGVWYFTKSKAAADFSVWFSYSLALADLTVCFVGSRDVSGWRRPHRLSDKL